MKINKLASYLISLLPFQRKMTRKALMRSNPDALRSKKFRKAYDAQALALGTERRLAMHRASCLTGYAAKRAMVEAGKGNHKFIHPQSELA